MGEKAKPMEENDRQVAADGSRQQSVVLKTAIIKTLKELQAPLPKDDPASLLIDSLIADVKNETNEIKLYHKIKILNESLQTALTGE